MTRLAYVDASAHGEARGPETASAAMLRWYVEAERLATSRLGIIETTRAAVRHPHDADHLRFVLGSIEVVELDPNDCEPRRRRRPALLASPRRHSSRDGP